MIASKFQLIKKENIQFIKKRDDEKSNNKQLTIEYDKALQEQNDWNEKLQIASLARYASLKTINQCNKNEKKDSKLIGNTKIAAGYAVELCYKSCELKLNLARQKANQLGKKLIYSNKLINHYEREISIYEKAFPMNNNDNEVPNEHQIHEYIKNKIDYYLERKEEEVKNYMQSKNHWNISNLIRSCLFLVNHKKQYAIATEYLNKIHELRKKLLNNEFDQDSCTSIFEDNEKSNIWNLVNEEDEKNTTIFKNESQQQEETLWIYTWNKTVGALFFQQSTKSEKIEDIGKDLKLAAIKGIGSI